MTTVTPPPAGCSAEELRTLFLFEHLTADQLDWLCREGRVEQTGPGPVYAEGDPATCFYVLLDGTIVLSRRVGVDDIEVTRTSQRGVYAGPSRRTSATGCRSSTPAPCGRWRRRGSSCCRPSRSRG